MNNCCTGGCCSIGDNIPCKSVGISKGNDCNLCLSNKCYKDSIIGLLKRWWDLGVPHAPYIGENNNWYEWDTVIEDYRDTGIPANGNPGPAGEQGPQGADGKSAYEVWLDQGNIGTVDDFFNSLGGTRITNLEQAVMLLTGTVESHNTRITNLEQNEGSRTMEPMPRVVGKFRMFGTELDIKEQTFIIDPTNHIEGEPIYSLRQKPIKLTDTLVNPVFVTMDNFIYTSVYEEEFPTATITSLRNSGEYAITCTDAAGTWVSLEVPVGGYFPGNIENIYVTVRYCDNPAESKPIFEPTWELNNGALVFDANTSSELPIRITLNKARAGETVSFALAHSPLSGDAWTTVVSWVPIGAEGYFNYTVPRALRGERLWQPMFQYPDGAYITTLKPKYLNIVEDAIPFVIILNNGQNEYISHPTEYSQMPVNLIYPTSLGTPDWYRIALSPDGLTTEGGPEQVLWLPWKDTGKSVTISPNESGVIQVFADMKWGGNEMTGGNHSPVISTIITVKSQQPELPGDI